MQKHISVGRLVSDPKIKRFDSQGSKSSSVTNFCLAVDNMRKDKNGEKIVTYIDYKVWNAQGENLVKYAKKGKELYVEGEFLRSEYEDKETKKKIYYWYVQVDKIQYLGGSQNSGSQNSDSQNNGASNQKEVTAPVENKPQKSEIDMELEQMGYDLYEDDDVPF